MSDTDTKQTSSGASDAGAYDGPTAADNALRQISDALRRIERERKRVRPEDWATLFRQTERVLSDLVDHPFVKGDREAEIRLANVIYSVDLEDMDRQVDRLAEYLIGKLEFNMKMREQDSGKKDNRVPRYVAPASSTTEATRAQARHGPSGSDFDLTPPSTSDPGKGGNDTSKPPSRRSVLRL